MNLLALVLVGFPGSGKTTASVYFRSVKIPVIRMGDLTDITLSKLNLPKTAVNETKIRRLLRKEFDEEVYSKFALKKINKFYGTESIVAVEGLKSEKELKFLEKKLRRLKIIFISAKRKIRFERLAKREIRPLNFRQAINRDNEEKRLFKVKHLKEISDFIVKNESSIFYFHNRLKKILKIIQHDSPQNI